MAPRGDFFGDLPILAAIFTVVGVAGIVVTALTSGNPPLEGTYVSAKPVGTGTSQVEWTTQKLSDTARTHHNVKVNLLRSTNGDTPTAAVPILSASGDCRLSGTHAIAAVIDRTPRACTFEYATGGKYGEATLQLSEPAGRGGWTILSSDGIDTWYDGPPINIG